MVCEKNQVDRPTWRTSQILMPGASHFLHSPLLIITVDSDKVLDFGTHENDLGLPQDQHYTSYRNETPHQRRPQCP
jgi:hypothetical protein